MIWHGTNLKIGDREMKKYIVTLANMPQNQIACINNHIAVGSLFGVGESITDNTLHSGKNIVDDKRVIDTLVWYKQALDCDDFQIGVSDFFYHISDNEGETWDNFDIVEQELK